tara:strand:+ start:918 stop:2075 length:1158 start_codon:yes stop_codon:yes gene_type:complete
MFKKALLVFISLRIIGILFTFNIFNKLQRGYGDARFLIGGVNLRDADLSLPFFANTTTFNYAILNFLPDGLILASIILTFITSTIIWKNLKNFLITKNSSLLWIAIFIPSYCVHTILPSKEATFISLSLIYICFEANNIIFKPVNQWNNISLFFQRFLYIFLFLLVRGLGSAPYIFLGFFVTLFPFISPFLMKYKNNKVNIFIFLSISSIFTLLIIFIISSFENQYLVDQSLYLKGSFLQAEGSNTSREYLLNRDTFSLGNYFLLFPYLSLFPTIQELLTNPKLIFYVIDSSIYIGLYFIAWNKVINIAFMHPRKIKFFQYLFIIITITYILIYGTIGAFNLGSSLRFRQNFTNIGLIFPLIIFYNSKKSKNIFLSKSLKDTQSI